jgi:ABC-type nitrate/sulfonate/bicarbonate transport system substrate-binding protein
MARWKSVSLALVIVTAGLAWLLATSHGSPAVLPRVTMLTTRTPFSAAVVLADKRGWFREAGVEVVLVDRASGKEALAALVDGNGDYATASETPIMFALLKGQPLRILSSLSVGTDTLTIVARRDRGVVSSDDLAGKRIGFALGTNSQYFLDTFLEYRGIRPDAVMRIPVKPEELVAALRDGRVDAISAWVPYNLQALAELGANAQELRVGPIYRWSWDLVARNETVARNATSERLLSALIRATAALREDPVACAHELAPDFNLPVESLVRIWQQTLFDITLDQSLLLSLEIQGRWALDNGQSVLKEVPNFLPAVSTHALRAVDRGLVTLIDHELLP